MGLLATQFRVTGVIAKTSRPAVARALAPLVSGKVKPQNLEGALRKAGFYLTDTTHGDLLIMGAAGDKTKLANLVHVIEDAGGFIVGGLRPR